MKQYLGPYYEKIKKKYYKNDIYYKDDMDKYPLYSVLIGLILKTVMIIENYNKQNKTPYIRFRMILDDGSSLF